ncbi:hypothetical protein BDW02DRAFT_498490 [Decorospora gaudefroyi]|uniref:Chromatin modification-related protein n=1 Tax=Decorospora gaudefroyi TaxID=184978 RepID=A0A6A5KDL4_9PLEO|nr:hypothetical protein BDW02DRAFT_498490 [Decorospora gaudefroyi]
MPPTTGTRTSTRQGRATVRPTNYYARTFAGRLAASGLEQTPEASNSAPGFLPALTHFTGAVDAFPKEIIKHFSLFKEVEAKLHDPEHALGELLADMAQQPVMTRAQLPTLEDAAVQKRQQFLRLRILIQSLLPTLDEKLVVLQGAKATKDKALARMHHSYAQLDGEISDEARYGSLMHWAYADKEEKKKGGPSHERQRREVAAANNLAAAAQHVHDVDSITAKSEARREAMQANKRSRQQHVDSDFDDRPVKKPQKRKAMPTEATATAPDMASRNIGLGIAGHGAGPHGKRKKTEKALAAAAPAALAAPAAPPMERSVSSALKAAGNGVRGGSSPRGTPGPENTATKRKPRAAAVPAQRKNPLPPYSPPLASSPLAANFAINKAIAGASDRPLSARARKNSLANSIASANAQDVPPARRPSSSHSVHHAASSNAITELEHAAGLVRDSTWAKGAPTPKEPADAPPPFDTSRMKLEDLGQPEPEGIELDVPTPVPATTRPGRTSKTATPVVGAFPEISMARSRSSRNANNSNSNTSSENNSTTTGTVSKRGHKKNAQPHAAMPSPAMKAAPNLKSNPPSSAASSVAQEQDTHEAEAEAESEEDGDEPRYCYCHDISYGDMIACDNDDCPREWFHLACVHLEKAPTGRTKWFCSDECKDTYAKAKAKGGRPGSSRQ